MMQPHGQPNSNNDDNSAIDDQARRSQPKVKRSVTYGKRRRTHELADLHEYFSSTASGAEEGGPVKDRLWKGNSSGQPQWKGNSEGNRSSSSSGVQSVPVHGSGQHLESVGRTFGIASKGPFNISTPPRSSSLGVTAVTTMEPSEDDINTVCAFAGCSPALAVKALKVSEELVRGWQSASTDSVAIVSVGEE